MTRIVCWNCGADALPDGAPAHVERRSDCRHCRAELHCCRMCRHWSATPGATGCREERAEPPNRDDVANFCDWFALAGDRAPGAASREDDSRAALDALFDAPPAGSTSRDALAQDAGAPSDEGAALGDDDADARARRARAGLDDLFR